MRVVSSVRGLVLATFALAVTAGAQTETHTNLQSVTDLGTSAWSNTHPFTLRGVLINKPEDMLDATWDPDAEDESRMGAEWQVFIQTVAADDRGGTALWMGQNYSSLGPWIPAGNSYSETQWSNEMYRLNHDTNAAHHFRAGDLVEVTANQSLFYGGKRNVNEAHRTNELNDFHITLVEAGRGLPDPEVITLTNLVAVDDGNPSTHEDIFDPTRQTGGEHYQGMRVRIEGIRMATNGFGTNGWGKTAWSERRCTVTDGEGRFFTLRMPLSDLGPMPRDWFSAVGILNQESGSGSDGTFGYELFAQEIGPTVRYVVSGGTMLVYWSGTYTNYVLQYTTNLNGSAGWTNVTAVPVKWIAVEQELEDPQRYYRVMQRN